MSIPTNTGNASVTYEGSGSTVSRSTYAILFNAIGTSYGAGDGTTFNLQDFCAAGVAS